MNKFLTHYTREQEIKAAYEAAKEQGNDEGIKAARANHKDLAKEVNAEGSMYARLFREFLTSMERKNPTIVITETIWDEEEVAEIVKCLKENGFPTFVYSSTSTRTTENVWFFTKNGARLEGMVEVNGMEHFDGTIDKNPAFLFSIQ